MKVDTNKCVGCGCCMGSCPVGAIELKDGKASINTEKCIKCETCAGLCPMQAITKD